VLIQDPTSFIVRQECDQLTHRNGFRLPQEEADGWRRYESTTAQGSVWLAAAGSDGPWFLALDHPGVIAELKLPPDEMPGLGLSRYQFADLGMLYEVMPRLYELAVSLPDAPLQEFQDQIQNLPRTTEAERLVVQRVGQNIFRDRLMNYWRGICPLTGISDPDLLRASHIIPWKECDTDRERLNTHNGLLLSALWDAAFDKGLVTFQDDGLPLFSPALSTAARAELRWNTPISLTDSHRQRLAWHREHLFQVAAPVAELHVEEPD
jgi:hypothetical protein